MQLSISEAINTISNKSTLSWTLTVAGGSVPHYSVAPTQVTINGTTVYSKGATPWESAVFPAAKGSVSGSIDVPHNSDGKKTITIGFSTSIWYGTAQEYGGTLTLANIDRTAPSVSISTSSVRASSVYVTATASTTCDVWEYTTNNWSTATQYSTGGKTSANVTISNLTPNTSYTIAVRARKQSNRVVGYSGTSTIKTLGGSVINSISTFTADNSTAKISLSVTVYNTSYKHSLTLKDGSTSVLTLSGLTLSNGTNTITLSSSQRSTVLSAMSSKKSYNGTFELKTYSGSTQIGTISSKKATVQTTSANSSPTFSGFTYSDSNASSVAVTGNNKILVQGISTLKVVATAATAKNGATISSYSVVAGSKTASSSTTTINVGTISNTGTVPIIVTAIDSRGWTTVVTVNMTVIAYSRTDITDYMMRRINEVEDTTQVSISGTISPVKVGGVNKNTFKYLNYRYKKTNTSSYGSWNTLISQTSYDSDSFIFESAEWISLDAEYSWHVEFNAGDSLSSDTVVLTIPQGTPLLSFRKKKVGVNKRNPVGALDVVGDVYHNGSKVDLAAMASSVSLLQNGSFSSPYSPPNFSDFNDMKKPGIYLFSTNSSVSGMSNYPIGSAGYLLVFAPNATGSYGVLQVYFPYDSSSIYTRHWNWGSTTWPAWRTNLDELHKKINFRMFTSGECDGIFTGTNMLTLLYARKPSTGQTLFAIGNTSTSNTQAFDIAHANGLKINATNSFGSVQVTNSSGDSSGIWAFGISVSIY